MSSVGRKRVRPCPLNDENEEMQTSRYIDIHTHARDTDEMVTSVSDIPLEHWDHQAEIDIKSPFSISLHPCGGTVFQGEKLRHWVTLHRNNPHWVALGEVGFDPCSPLTPDERFRLFVEVARIAEEEKKFLIVHCVKEFAALRKAYDLIRPQRTWILHGFRKNATTMRQWLLPNIAFGIGAHQPPELVDQLPLDRVFFETDDQSIESIGSIYQKFADQRGLTADRLKQQIEDNYNKITHKIANDEFC